MEDKFAGRPDLLLDQPCIDALAEMLWRFRDDTSVRELLGCWNG